VAEQSQNRYYRGLLEYRTGPRPNKALVLGSIDGALISENHLDYNWSFLPQYRDRIMKQMISMEKCKIPYRK
jgi:hypothetical protein